MWGKLLKFPAHPPYKPIRSTHEQRSETGASKRTKISCDSRSGVVKGREGSWGVVRGRQGSSGARGRQGSSGVVRGRQGSSGVVRGRQGSSGVVRGRQGSSGVVRSRQRSRSSESSGVVSWNWTTVVAISGNSWGHYHLFLVLHSEKMFSNIFERCRFTGNLTSTDGMNNPWIERDRGKAPNRCSTYRIIQRFREFCMFLNRLNIKQLRSKNGPSLIAAIQELYGVVIHN